MCISFLRRFISFLPQNQIFTTRDVLFFGSRSAIDQALRRLVKAQRIVRLARGVFMKEGSKYPTAIEVAQAKCRAFGKQIAKHGLDLAKELGLVDKLNQQTVFTTAGHTSQFWFGNVLIKIKGISQRKMHLNEHKAGRAIAAFWYLGKQLCQSHQIAKSMRHLDYTDRQYLRKSSSMMPAWLSRFYAKLIRPKFLPELKQYYDWILAALLQSQLDVIRNSFTTAHLRINTECNFTP